MVSGRLEALLRDYTDVWEMAPNLWAVRVDSETIEVIGSMDLSGERFWSLDGAMRAYKLTARAPRQLQGRT